MRVPVKWGYGEAPGGGRKLESGRDEATSKVACITKYLMAIHKELDEFDLSTLNSSSICLSFLTVSYGATLVVRDGLPNVYVNVSTAARPSPGRPATSQHMPNMKVDTEYARRRSLSSSS